MAAIHFSTAEILRFAVVLFRICGIMAFAPFFSSQLFSYQIRIAFAVVATPVMISSLPLGIIPAEFSLGNIVTLILSETVIGMILGLIASFIFAGMEQAGQIISFQLGLSLVNVIDPQSEVEANVFSFLYNCIGLLFFLLLNGHHWFFLAVSQSFDYLPVSGIHLNGPLVEQIIRLSSQIFSIGLKIAGPVVAVNIISDVVLGIIGRTAPQINILIEGMPFKILAGLSCLSISFYFLPRLLDEAYSSLFSVLFALVHRIV